MKAMVLGALVLLVASCNDQPKKPTDVVQRLEAGDLSDEDLNRVTSLFPGMTRECIARVRADGTDMMGNRADECFEMTPSQHWRGVWIDAFEGSQFCEAPATECSFDSKPRVWIDVPGRKCCTFVLYEVEFIGWRTKYPGVFGHMGAFDHEMIVDRMISIRPAPKK